MTTEKKDGGTAMRDKKMAMIHFWERPENICVLMMWRQSVTSLDAVAKLMRITKNTLFAYMQESEKIKTAMRFGHLQNLAIAEHQLIEQVKKGNMDAIKHFLKYHRRSLYDHNASGLYDEATKQDEGLFDVMTATTYCNGLSE